MTDDRFSDEYDPEPDYDRPSTVAEAEADEAGMPIPYCDLCEKEGHSFRSCPERDDRPDLDAEKEAEADGLEDVEAASRLVRDYRFEGEFAMDVVKSVRGEDEGEQLSLFDASEYDDEHARLIKEMHESERASDDNREMYR